VVFFLFLIFFLFFNKGHIKVYIYIYIYIYIYSENLENKYNIITNTIKTYFQKKFIFGNSYYLNNGS
jgi:hypothetical protein